MSLDESTYKSERISRRKSSFYLNYLLVQFFCWFFCFSVFVKQIKRKTNYKFDIIALVPIWTVCMLSCCCYFYVVAFGIVWPVKNIFGSVCCNNNNNRKRKKNKQTANNNQSVWCLAINTINCCCCCYCTWLNKKKTINKQKCMCAMQIVLITHTHTPNIIIRTQPKATIYIFNSILEQTTTN